MELERTWAMPNKDTFSIKPINKLISRLVSELRVKKMLCGGVKIIDPFCNGDKSGFSDLTNDLDPEIEADYHLDALDFLKTIDTNSVDCVLFDPPYSPRQVSECYKKMDMTVNMQTTQSSFWGNMKKEISRIVKDGGIVISCGWNSGGIGKTNGFEITEILLVAHGGWHNDTIVTVESRNR